MNNNYILDTLFSMATKGSDGFRQWFYPNLPKSYKINSRITAIIEADRKANIDKEETLQKLIKESKK